MHPLITKVFIENQKYFNYPYGKRNGYETISKLLNFPTYSIRKYLGIKVIKRYRELPSIPKKDGFLVWFPQKLAPVTQVIGKCREYIANVDQSIFTKKGKGKEQYLRGIHPDDSKLTESLVKLACDPTLVSIVTKYIGILPIINGVKLLYSPNKKIYEGGAQFFHLDPEGVRQIKLYIYVEDVTEESGPLTLIPAQESHKIYRLYPGGRLRDDWVSRFIDPQYFYSITGASGTMIFADTSRCFHFGSRPGKKPRFVIIIQYISPFAINFPWFGWVRKPLHARLVNHNTSTIDQYLLGVK
ncbi:MAG: phytanoyl-CoA dioxygenase family protein [Moorea sp. SIOASIH]|uniref:hypothetical protein n=1 Tax=Moorena sp. SIOASIH TaxID=2607817 RepID=UPI0013BC4B5E|nr:hypothetical protein [Moorena sp. SIOASIH]NEO38068.1 phytanoyl-CoA dioxygenase family protein [Moorena sp. SIOASIH]